MLCLSLSNSRVYKPLFSIDYYGKKIDAVQDEIRGIDSYLAQLKRKEKLFIENLDKLKLQNE